MIERNFELIRISRGDTPESLVWRQDLVQRREDFPTLEDMILQLGCSGEQKDGMPCNQTLMNDEARVFGRATRWHAVKPKLAKSVEHLHHHLIGIRNGQGCRLVELTNESWLSTDADSSEVKCGRKQIVITVTETRGSDFDDLKNASHTDIYPAQRKQSTDLQKLTPMLHPN